jgi:hypothetical protein
MTLRYRLILTGLPAAALAAPAESQTVDLSIAIPRLKVAEYHAPYVAVWLEGAGQPARTLAVWYDLDNKEGGAQGGKKWLADVRQWWRASGRSTKLPAAGISGATRPPGTHRVSLAANRGPLAGLAPGQYTLVVEAAREVGGRELVRLPFAWPQGGTASAAGKSEFGQVNLTIRR